MMRHIFFSEESILSPRWTQAFPDALIIERNYSDLLQSIHALDQQESVLVWLLASQKNQMDLTKKIQALPVKLIALTAGENFEEARRFVEQGAAGYLHFFAAVPVLIQVAQVVEQDGLWLGVNLMRQLVGATAKVVKADTSDVSFSSLTDREKSVASLVADGKTNKEIARELLITERTVKAHLSTVFEKLGVRDRLQLVLKMSRL